MTNKKKIRVVTLGCSKNTVDTEHLLACFPEDRFEILDSENSGERVDCLMLNTCGFIGDAKEESVGAVLRAVESKKQGLAGEVVVFGCLSQRYRNALAQEIPEVDAWYGARDLTEVLAHFGLRSSGGFIRRRREDSAGYAYLKISEGCDRRCSYCAIPFIRGAHKSVPMEDLLEEASSLAKNGVKELILIAQDTTYYGLDLYGKRSLAQLLENLSNIDGIRRLRIHYSYPSDFPEDVLEQMATNPKVCRYLDIPLQHISDGVLGGMHRGVDGKRTRELVARLRKEVPGVAFRTTMIVGHPGETEDEFKELLQFVEETKFERLGAFTYSEEEGTFDALHYKDDVPVEVKNARLDRLMSLQSEISLAYNSSRVGSETCVIVDSILENGVLVCRSEFESPEVDGEIYVNDASGKVRAGDFINVRITGAEEYDLTAEMIL